MSAATAAFTPEQMALLLEENQQLRAENKELRRMLFGSKRERFVAQADTAQLSLDLASSSGEPAVVVKQTVIYERAVKQMAKKAIRGGFPAHLPRVDVILEPDEDVSGMRKMDLPIRSCILGPGKRSPKNWISSRPPCLLEGTFVPAM